MNNYNFKVRYSPLVNTTARERKKEENKSNIKFKDILKKNIEKKENDGPKLNYKISAHAKKRMEQRNIVLPREDLLKIEKVFDKLEEKGSKESLIIYKDIGFICSIKNRTIITALYSSDMDIVTNIDSTIIVK